MNFSEFVSKHGDPLSTSAGQHVFRQGDPDRSLYVVKTGLLKAYHLSDDGKENIKSFILPGDNIGSLMAAYLKKTCSFSLLCLQDCDLIRIDFDALYQASRNDLEISGTVIDFLLAFAMKKERREYELLCLSAEERYRQLLDKTPALPELVTQNEISLYLGITPVGLSRIKKRVLSEGGD